MSASCTEDRLLELFGREHSYRQIRQSEVQTPAASIITTVYQCGPAAVARAIASALDQASRYSYEVVVVDDGCPFVPPPTPEDPRMTWVRQSHRGPSMARNLAAHFSRAPVILNLDADDALLPNAVELLVTALSDSDAVLAYADGYWEGPLQGGRWEQHNRIATDGARHSWRKPDYDPELLLRDMYLGHPQAFRRDAWAKARGYDPEIPSGQDWDFALRLAQLGRFVRVPEFAHVYYWRDSGISATTPHHVARKQARGIVLRAMRARGVTDLEEVPADLQSVYGFVPEDFGG